MTRADPSPPRTRSHDAYNFMENIRADPETCLRCTGQPSFECIESLLDYLDADGAMTNMQQFRDPCAADDPPPPPRKSAAGRKPALSSLIARFCLFLLIFRKLRSHVDTAGKMFGVSSTVAMRVYVTWVCAISYFSKHQQPVPTAAQAAAQTPARTSARLALPGRCAVYLSDATERKMGDCSDEACHNANNST